MDTSYTYNVVNDVPRTVYFYATSFCNSNCSYCSFRKSNPAMTRGHIDFESFINVLDESKLLQECKFVLQGGEFTEHPEYLKIARFFKGYESHKIPTILLTNCIEPDKVLELESEVDFITISYDGVAHDLVRGTPKNTEKILYFLSNRKKLAPVTLQMTLGSWNMGYRSFVNFFEVCKAYDVGVRLNVAQSSGLLKNGSYKITSQQVASAYGHIRAQAVVRDIDVAEQLEYLMYVRSSLATGRVSCKSLSMYTTITATGDVLLCQGLDYERAVIGNVFVDKFDDIWNRAADTRKKYVTCNKCYLGCNLQGEIKYRNELKLLEEKRHETRG